MWVGEVGVTGYIRGLLSGKRSFRDVKLILYETELSVPGGGCLGLEVCVYGWEKYGLLGI